MMFHHVSLCYDYKSTLRPFRACSWTTHYIWVNDFSLHDESEGWRFGNGCQFVILFFYCTCMLTSSQADITSLIV